MKIRSLRVEHFRKFDQPALIDGFGDGLNLLIGPNETGKSTLLLALRAALFERHGAKTQAVNDFSPHRVTGARPTVTLDFETADTRFRLEKSFLRRPAAKLETSAGDRFEGSEAEAELKRLIGLDPSEKTSANKESPAHFGVLLTPQTLSFHQPDLADGTRHSLEAAIAAEIAELGNQSEVDGLLTEFDERLFGIVSKRGEPKNRYKDVTTRLSETEREIVETSAERDALRDQMERLQQSIKERNQLMSGESRENLIERLAALEAARTRAAHRQMLENHRLAASQRLQAAEAKRTARQARQNERQRVADDIEAIDEAAEEARIRLGFFEETLSEREAELAGLGERQQGVEKRLRELDALARHYDRLRQIEMTLSALATDVRLDLEASALDHVALDGEPAQTAKDHRQVIEGLSIDITGIGRIDIQPKTEPMRETLLAKAEVEGEIGNLRTSLDLEDAEPEAIETAWQAVKSERDALAASRSEIDSALADVRQQAAETKAVLDASHDRKTHLMQHLADIDADDDTEGDDQATLDAEIADAQAAFGEADAAFQAEVQREGPSVAQPIGQLDVDIRALRRRIESQRRMIEDASQKVVALESSIAVRSGLGLDEKIDQLRRRQHLLAEERDAFALDHRALLLLQSTLREAADETKATFNAPLSARLAPYIQDLFPGATPLVTPDFGIRALDRGGTEEPFRQLSDGTREQIAILARLAFADMLQEQGLPALIVLDDALAFSDDQRFSRMLSILKKVSERMQVIILTCREERFSEVEATRLAIDPAPEQTSSAA